ncbi:uncharacterized protein LOC126909157 [Daktulosphaira vitifoliae]|uniref:uncharacterized protein LOC126909157 n=1 Tax=Daktulosphaira vitifoliae TaxID=58002 RepID=UPI0021AA352C|nr:uncharacterized protein LOC126909157 [Daktulosphaira vitifoliae]
MSSTSLNKMPDEVLLIVFRYTSAADFVTSLPVVCDRWAELVLSDTHTLNRIGIQQHPYGQVSFFYLHNKYEHLIDHTAKEHENLFHFAHNFQLIDYSHVFELSIQYSNIYLHLKTLVISNSLQAYRTEGFICLNNLSEITFYNIHIRETDCYTLTELSSVFSNVQNVSYVNCRFSAQIEQDYLHNFFKNIKRFRMDHYSVSDRMLKKLLTSHPQLIKIIFAMCTVMSDGWLEEIMDNLGRRTVVYLEIHSSYFTDKCIAKFLHSKVVTDLSKIHIHKDKHDIPFKLIMA